MQANRSFVRLLFMFCPVLSSAAAIIRLIDAACSQAVNACWKISMANSNRIWILPNNERNYSSRFEQNRSFSQLNFEGGIVFLHESQDKKLLDLSRNRLENECRQRVAALRRTATARGLMIRQKEPHEEVALLPVYKFIQFIQFTMQLQSPLRMVLVGAVQNYEHLSNVFTVSFCFLRTHSS